MHTSGSLLLVLALALSADGERPTSPIGKTIENFQLQDYLGTSHELSEWRGRAVAIVFLGTECPLAKLYAVRLAKLAEILEPQGVTVVGINSNSQDSLTELAHYARTHDIEFPLLKDPGNVVADQFGAQRTPEVFLLDQERVVRYWGRIDDQYGVGYARNEPGQNFLAAAVAELLAGKPVSTPVTEPVGCRIGRLPRQTPTGDITYSKHVAAILQKRCVECHREGEIAPFAMTNYREVVGWGETIREVIEQRRMPPWHANPEHGKFANDARLPEEEKELIFRWLDNGAPEGNPADLPPPAEFIDGWRIPKPDIVYKMPEPFLVPAKGTVPYKYFTVDPGFTEDKWLLAAEARPGNRAVTHHLILFFHPPDGGAVDPLEPLFNSIAAFAPGLPPARFDPAIARRIPAGSKLIFQAHYTPNGTEQYDQSEIGLVFADPAKVKQEITVSAGFNWQFKIPAGADNYRVEASHRFDRDTTLYSLTPHMHLRGKAFRFEALYPDKTREILLDVPRYDFNWQNYYILAEPKPMPEGTKIEMVAFFDNSEQNLANPDPGKDVRFGEQTWEEMMVGTMAVTPAEQDLTLAAQVTALQDGRYAVRFAYRPTKPAETVYLSGTFNEWKKEDLKMEGPDEQGVYSKTLELAAGSHEYKFLIDGQWRSDPNNPNHTGFFRNSLLVLGKGEK